MARITKDELIRIVGKEKAEELLGGNKTEKKPKYGNKKIWYEGKRFDSKKEYWRFRHLEILEKKGIISNLKCQVPFVLTEKAPGQRAMKYYADFEYWENGKRIIEDTKGYKTRVYINKKKVLLDKYKGEFIFLET